MNAKTVDEDIRTLAKMGTSDDAGINYTATWEGCTMCATFGAGTNSASITMNLSRIVLYRGGEYGRYVEVLREGPWAARLHRDAEKVREQQVAQKELRNRKEHEQHHANFAAIDF